MKTCSICNIEKDIEDFSFKNKFKNIRASYCKPCHNERANTWYLKNKEIHKKKTKLNRKNYKIETVTKLFNFLKLNPCAHCGETNPILLEFDHIKGKKLSSVSAMVGNFSWKSIEQEIGKCQVLCAHCHRLKTAKERTGLFTDCGRTKRA